MYTNISFVDGKQITVEDEPETILDGLRSGGNEFWARTTFVGRDAPLWINAANVAYINGIATPPPQ